MKPRLKVIKIREMQSQFNCTRLQWVRSALLVTSYIKLSFLQFKHSFVANCYIVYEHVMCRFKWKKVTPLKNI